MSPTLPNGSSTTGGASSPGVKIRFSVSHRWALRYTARVPAASTIAALLYSFPSGPRGRGRQRLRRQLVVLPDAAVRVEQQEDAAGQVDLPGRGDQLSGEGDDVTVPRHVAGAGDRVLAGGDERLVGAGDPGLEFAM